MVQTPVRQMTLEEFLLLPDTKPASEYIDGQIIQKPMPQGHHSIIQGELLTELTLVLKRKGIATALPELRCTFGGRALAKPLPWSLVPDLAVFENARIPTNGGQIENVFTIPPDWTIEVLSPGQSANKVLKKINHCLAHGTKMGWLIDPEDRSIIISRSDRNLEVIDELNVVLPVPDFAKSIELTVERLFGWLTLM